MVGDSESKAAGTERSRRIHQLSLLLGPGLVLLSALVALGSGLGTRLGWWGFPTGFAILRWGVYGSLAGVVVSVACGFLALRGGFRWSLPVALLGLLLGLVVVVVPLRMIQKARTVPPINDITTDTQNPPQFHAVLPLRGNARTPATYPGENMARVQHQAYPDLKSEHFAQPPAQVLNAAQAVAKELGWRIVSVDPAKGRLEATDTTFWFGFTDDIVVRVVPDGSGSRLDVRSHSRVGRSDLGTNAERIRSFLTKLKARGLTPVS